MSLSGTNSIIQMAIKILATEFNKIDIFANFIFSLQNLPLESCKIFNHLILHITVI